MKLCKIAKKLGGVISLLCATASAATIEWEEARNVGADADVSTEGDLVCAYNENNVDVTINGVLFKGANSVAWLPFASAKEHDIQLADFRTDGWRQNTFCPSFTPSATLSQDYQHLLHGGVFRGAGTATVTLLGLQPGEEYLVQIWINDNRSNASPCDVVIGGSCTVNSHPTGATYGQFAIGRFRADSSSQNISLYSAVSPFFNSIQVRKLPSIAWGKPQLTTNDSDVNNSGTTLYAYHFINNNYTYEMNGVTFNDGGYAGGKMSANVGLSHDGGGDRDFRSGGDGDLDRKTVYPDGTSAYYPHILGHALYLYVGNSASEGAWMDMTLKNLVPGRKYAVQMWHVDARHEDSACALYQKIDGVRSLYAYDSENGYRGHTVTGVFVAESTNKTIRVRGYNTTASTRNNPLLNAFQVRDITDAEPAIENAVGALTSDAVVRTDGEPVYAYTAANANLTVNGVAFAAQSSYTSWGTGNVQLTGFTARTDSAFYSNASTDFERMLAGGVYARSWEVNNKNPAPAFLTFNGLEPFSPYLIQVFVNDSRSGTEDRRVKFGDNGSFTNYQSSCALVVRPVSSSYTLNLWYTASEANNISPQVNAVQVRRLSETAGGSLVWSGGASGTWATSSTGWTGDGVVPENPWSAENGASRDAVIGDGTTLTVADGVTARNLIAQGALTLNGLPTLMGEIMGGDVTVASALMVDTIVKTYDGSLTFSGNRSRLRQATVTSGVLALTANDPTDLRRVLVYAPGALKISGTGKILSGLVSGTLETSGALTASSDVKFEDGWILRRTSGAAMTIDCETFDLSSIAKVCVSDPAALDRGYILTTTGHFTGELPDVESESRHLHLEIKSIPGGGEALRIKKSGLTFILR